MPRVKKDVVAPTAVRFNFGDVGAAGADAGNGNGYQPPWQPLHNEHTNDSREDDMDGTLEESLAKQFLTIERQCFSPSALGAHIEEDLYFAPPPMPSTAYGGRSAQDSLPFGQRDHASTTIIAESMDLAGVDRELISPKDSSNEGTHRKTVTDFTDLPELDRTSARGDRFEAHEGGKPIAHRLHSALRELQDRHDQLKEEDAKMYRARLRWTGFIEGWIIQQEDVIKELVLEERRDRVSHANLALPFQTAPSLKFSDEDGNVVDPGRSDCTGDNWAKGPSHNWANAVSKMKSSKIVMSKGISQLFKSMTFNLEKDPTRATRAEHGQNVFRRISAFLKGTLMSLQDKEKKRQSRLSRLIGSTSFDVFSCGLILLSTAINGWETEVRATSPGRADKLPFQQIAIAFALLFFIELMMRLAAFGRAFFISPTDWHWNLFDFICVLISGVEMYFTVTENDSGVNLGTQRVLRTIRVVRNLRIIRVFRFFNDLRQMLKAVFGSLKTLCWLAVLLAMILYFFAICLVSGVTDSLFPDEGQAYNRSKPEFILRDSLDAKYGSLAKAQLSLFKAMTCGDNWGLLMEPLQETSPWLVMLFLFFIIFTVFAFTNAVTSVFVDNIMQATANEKEDLIDRQIKQRREQVEALQGIFKDSDVDRSGWLSREELVVYLEDKRVRAHFRALGLDFTRTSDLFDMLDLDGNGLVEMDEFLQVCLKLMGPAQAMDLAQVKIQTRHLHQKFKLVLRHFDKVLNVHGDKGAGKGKVVGVKKDSAASEFTDFSSLANTLNVSHFLSLESRKTHPS